MNDINTDAQTVFTHVHICDAPRELVYQAFSTAEALNAWWGPANCDNSLISLDFRPGGIFHYRMVAGDTVNYGRFVFNRIDPPAFLDFTVSFADQQGNAIDAPFEVPLPKEILYRLTFTEEKGKTTIHMTGHPVNATSGQLEGFRSIRESMQEGFGGTFAKLSAYLAEKRG